MELPSIARPLIVDLALIAMIKTCGFQSRVGVRKNPRYRIWVDDLTTCLIPEGSE